MQWHFEKGATPPPPPPPANRLEATGILFLSDGVQLNELCRQKHNCPHFETTDQSCCILFGPPCIKLYRNSYLNLHTHITDQSCCIIFGTPCIKLYIISYLTLHTQVNRSADMHMKV